MVLTISSIKSEIIEEHYQCETFLIEALESGQAITLANAIRRTMLSELYGFAITGVRINDLKHEFETVDFLREDVLEILLNLKEIIFKPSYFLYYSDIQKIPLFLHVKGPCVVTASMFRLPVGMLNIVNPSQYICTITDDSEFYCEVEVEYGKGFRLKEEHGEKNEKFLENQLEEVTLSNLEEQFLDEIGQIPQFNESKDFDYKEKLSSENRKKFSLKKGLGGILKERILNIYSLLNEARYRLKKEEEKKRKKAKKIKKKSFAEIKKIVEEKVGIISEELENIIGDFIPPLGSPSLFLLDTNFVPVKNINFKVRLITDSLGNLKESLLLEITTNGSFTPRRCLQESVKLLINLFSPFLIIGYLDELIVSILPEFDNADMASRPLDFDSLKIPRAQRPNYWPDQKTLSAYLQKSEQEKSQAIQKEIDCQEKTLKSYQSVTEKYSRNPVSVKKNQRKVGKKTTLFITKIRERLKKKLADR